MFAVPVESKQPAQKKARVEVKSCGFFQKPNVKAATVPVPAGSGFVDNPLQKFGFTVQQKLKDGRVVDVAASSICAACAARAVFPRVPLQRTLQLIQLRRPIRWRSA
jgi:hypothetical protein